MAYMILRKRFMVLEIVKTIQSLLQNFSRGKCPLLDRNNFRFVLDSFPHFTGQVIK